MRAMNPALWFTTLTTAVALTFGSGQVQGQEAPLCVDSSETPTDIPALTAEGVTLQESLERTDRPRRYRFQVPTMSTVYVYVGDQWYDLDLGVFSSLGRDVACWRVNREAASERSQRRVLQLIRPDERVLEKLEPGEYLLTVRAAQSPDPSRPYTVRIALSPPVCGLDPANNEEDPKYPLLKRRVADDQNLYQLAVTYEPEEKELGPFSLMSFSAIVSPPYTDLFDFEWQIDGRPVPGATTPTLMKAASDFPRTADGIHKVTATARGARQYPDPDQPHIPPTLSVECMFQIKS